jgi:hypothetical protein
MSQPDLSITIYPLSSIEYDLNEFLKPASKNRASFTQNHYRCLPMVAANTLGWTLYNPFAFTVMWRGGKGTDALEVACESEHWIASVFGHGIFSIVPQFIVETSPGVDLLVRPVPHVFKLPVLPMEGVVETDWLHHFTLNYTMQLPLIKAFYDVGEPLAQLVPYPRHYIEDFQARIVRSGERYDAKMEELDRSSAKRQEFIDSYKRGENPSHHLDYMHGRYSDGTPAEDHKRLFHPRPFTEE